MTPPDHIATYFKTWPNPPKHIGVAVSGGSDSLALLLALKAAFPNARLHAVTVNHGLRSEAADEAVFVSQVCQQLNVAHDILTLNQLENGPNLQARARDVRYQAITNWAVGCDVVCLGHSKTDVSETFLMRLARGSGVDGLARMQDTWERDGITWCRPLLALSRKELQDYLNTRGQPWCHDASNDDDAFTRVRMRKALPTLDALGMDEMRLAQTAARMRKVQQALDFAADQLRSQVMHRDYCDIVINHAKLAALPTEFAERIVASALNWVGQQVYRPRNAALLRVLEADQDMTLHGCAILKGRAGTLRITREFAKTLAATTPGVTTWDGRFCAPDMRTDQRLGPLGVAGLTFCPEWRNLGIPRIALMASPAIWAEDQLISAPMLGFGDTEQVQIAAPPWEIALTR